jgi:AcrR family transcriptional regulator
MHGQPVLTLLTVHNRIPLSATGRPQTSGLESARGTMGTMPAEQPKAKPSKRDAILNAMLEVVVERGFHDSPMSLIAERAGASPGVIYHHFASKEEIIQALYDRVRTLKRTSLLQGYSSDMAAKDAFIQVATNFYHFYREHLREMRFLEQYEVAGFVCSPEKNLQPGESQTDFERRFSSRSQGGVLNDWPPEVIYELTLGLVIRLAKQPRTLTLAVLREVAEKVWEVVKAPDEK